MSAKKGVNWIAKWWDKLHEWREEENTITREDFDAFRKLEIRRVNKLEDLSCSAAECEGVWLENESDLVSRTQVLEILRGE